MLAAILTVTCSRALSAGADFRPPAVPLVTYNPFLSIWSESDHLNDATTKHWTQHDHSLVSLIRIDGKTYRLMGAEPKNVPAFAQKSVEVLPTRSIYEFEEAGVHVTMTFMQPALPDDLDVYSWPLSYITWNVRSCDGAKHKIELYDSTSSQLAVNNVEELVEWSRQTAGDLTLLRVGTQSPDRPRLLRRRSPHQLGLRLRRRAERAVQGGDRRSGGSGEIVRRQRRSARGRRHAHAACGRATPSR